jgi:hypothetical protein
VQSTDPKGPGARLAITDGGSEFVGFFPTSRNQFIMTEII